MNRSHHCCELTKEDAGISATLIGWINSIRDHGGILFIDLRDREGLTQVVIDPSNSNFSKVINDLKPESVIEVSGTVKLRSDDTVNLWSSILKSIPNSKLLLKNKDYENNNIRENTYLRFSKHNINKGVKAPLN